MSNRESWLQASAAGRELLLPTRELLEVISAPVLQPMPARPRGIGGVVLRGQENAEMFRRLALWAAGR